MTGGNLLSAFPRAELQGPTGRPQGSYDSPDDRSPDSRIDAERQSLPALSRPRARVGSLAGATLPRGELMAEHSDRRPSAPACRPLPAYSGGTVWDSHPLPGIVGSRAVGGQYSIPAPMPRSTSAAPPHRRQTRAQSATPGPRQGASLPSIRDACSTVPFPGAAWLRGHGCPTRVLVAPCRSGTRRPWPSFGPPACLSLSLPAQRGALSRAAR